MSRGRLLSTFFAELRPLDTSATAAVTATGVTSGYDPDYRESVHVDDGTWQGADAKRYGTSIRVRCQVEDKIFEQLDPMINGYEHQHEIDLIFHFRDLERAGLVDTSSGEAKVPVNTLLTAVYDRSGRIAQAMPTPGIFATESRPISWGMGRSLNLLLVSFKCREAGVKAP